MAQSRGLELGLGFYTNIAKIYFNIVNLKFDMPPTTIPEVARDLRKEVSTMTPTARRTKPTCESKPNQIRLVS